MQTANILRCYGRWLRKDDIRKIQTKTYLNSAIQKINYINDYIKNHEV